MQAWMKCLRVQMLQHCKPLLWCKVPPVQAVCFGCFVLDHCWGGSHCDAPARTTVHRPGGAVQDLTAADNYDADCLAASLRSPFDP